ncbi:hypothetical protein [Mesorhizobium sp. B263B2A]|uniref:hypothetical protein n=1 Tax=Mesorhizobium sp. B263B2A TaxID=2876669 RepID=UPI001CD1453E|nr:hypothetical protein [Mesorhizobium sp. B263B2A]MCA0032731.1 hypothetical protein [Mesorhizobium sp. B263B2A]
MGMFSRHYHRRWSDHDHYFGPFTYAHEKRGHYRPLAIVLGSGDDEYPGCDLRLSGFGHTLILALPQVLKPWRRKVEAKTWDAATIERLGRDWYWDTHEREYGFTCSEGHLSVMLGRQTNDSSTEQRWSKFLPWTQWRHVRKSFYGINGEHVATLPNTGKSYVGDPGRWERERAIEKTTPTVVFAFDDFDGERLSVATMIEEWEWKFGTGWFKWLSLFRAPKIRRSLDLRFSGETGERKGSWKGGTLGHSIDMLPGELHEPAFRRYCIKQKMTFVSAHEAA